MKLRLERRTRKLIDLVERRIGELEKLSTEVDDLNERLRLAHLRALVRDQDVTREAWESVTDACNGVVSAIDGLCLASIRLNEAADEVPS